MSKIVFALHDSVSYRCLKPIADALRTRSEVEYILFDDLLKTGKKQIPTSSLSKYRRAFDYVKHDFFRQLNSVDKQQPLLTIAVQRLIEDNISSKFAYEIDRLIRDTNPDVFVAAHDILPFIKHIIAESHRRDFSTAVVQHGINRPFLEDPTSVPGVPKFLTPSPGKVGPYEYIKRRVGFRHGAFVFCNPYVDELYTFGDFFTKTIANLRSEYPCFGKTNVRTTGSTEYNPICIAPYNPGRKSALFLSQWQLENEEWSDHQQNKVVDRVERFERNTGVRVHVRPHPKDSKEKIDRYFSDFKTSNSPSLKEDIDQHDVILTVDSTAIFQGIIEGKVCGVVQPPWQRIHFPPFTHEHIIQIGSNEVKLDEEIKLRSHRTQRDYINRFCYTPDINDRCSATTPVELVAEAISNLANR